MTSTAVSSHLLKNSEIYYTQYDDILTVQAVSSLNDNWISFSVYENYLDSFWSNANGNNDHDHSAIHISSIEANVTLHQQYHPVLITLLDDN